MTDQQTLGTELNPNDIRGVKATESGKPFFKTIEKANVVNCIIKLGTKEKNKQQVEFQPLYLQVTYQMVGQDQDHAPFFENFGGGRYMAPESVGKSPTITFGKQSALGQLIQLLKDTYKDYDGTIASIPDLLIGMGVGIQTVEVNFGDKIYKKNIIKTLYGRLESQPVQSQTVSPQVVQ